MDVNKIKRLSDISFAFRFITALFFVIFLNSDIVKAQEIEPDSLKTDTTQTEIKKLSPTVKDTIVNLELSDSTKKVEADSSFLLPKREKIIPARAALYSMVLPGLGQAYNGKYWKIPIIYTIFGTMYFFAAENHQKFEDYKFAYKNFDDENLKPAWVENQQINAAYLKERMEFYKRNRNFNIIVGGLFYLLNILDANVDAHLMDFDVSDDLSLSIEPELNYFQASQKNTNVSGFGIKFVLSLNR